MSTAQIRGGWPKVFREAITTSVRRHQLPFITWYLIVRSDAAVRMYFTEEDANADENYVVVPAPTASTPHGEWQGPAEVNTLWFKTASGTANIELVSFQRRG